MATSNTGIIALRLTAEETEKLEAMMSEDNETNKSRFIRKKLFTEQQPTPPDQSDLMEQLHTEISNLKSDKEFLQQQIITKDNQLNNQQLIQVQTQALLVDKSKSWYKPWTWGKKNTS